MSENRENSSAKRKRTHPQMTQMNADRKREGVEKRNHPQMKMMKKMKV
jgi:hypothetical protein